MTRFTDLEKYIHNSMDTKHLIFHNYELKRSIVDLAQLSLKTFQKGGKLIFAGNGGSFADSQHLAAEFLSKFSKDREPLPALALGTNTSNLSAIGNDFGFEHIFSRELKVIANKKDLFIPISTSGNSTNILEAVEVGKQIGLNCVGLTGGDECLLSSATTCIKVPSTITSHVQECHIMIGHFICKFVEEKYF